MILKCDRAKLLLQNYDNLGDGRVEIHPCTIVFPYEGPAESEAQRHRQTIILEAPDGAVLQFDQPWTSAGQKWDGWWAGNSRARSPSAAIGRSPAPKTTCWSPPATFGLPSRPSPRRTRSSSAGDRISAAARTWSSSSWPARPSRATATGGPNVAGIESFEIRHVERLHLDLGQTSGKRGRGSTPVEINCRGPFHFDVVHRVATFRDRVDVMKANPSGPSDQIACELLSLYFIEPPKKKPRPADSPESGTNSRGANSPRNGPRSGRRLARPGGRAARSPRQSGRRHGPQPEAHRPRAADRVQPAGQIHHAGRRPGSVPAARAERNPRPQPVLQVGRRGPIGPGDGAGAGLAPWPARTVAPTSSWRPSGGTNCWSTRANNIR